MPTLSMFFGIIIRMFADDHNPPHFHASYQNDNATFDLNGNLLEGDMPTKQQKLIGAWARYTMMSLLPTGNSPSTKRPCLRSAP